MTGEEWLACEYPKKMLECVETCRAAECKLRLFACACFRAGEQFDKYDAPAQEMVALAERMADSPNPREELTELGAVIRWAMRTQTFCLMFQPAFRAALVSSQLAADAIGQRAEGDRREDHMDVMPAERQRQAALLRDIFGNPFRPTTFAPEWRTDTAIALARQMYESRDFSAMPILADALQDAGCDNDDVLNHCRGDGSHVLGCWVVDLLLGKE